MKKNIAIIMGIAFALFIGGFAFMNMQNATTPEVTETEDRSYEAEMVDQTIESGKKLEKEIVEINNALDELAASDDASIKQIRAEHPDASDEEIQEWIVFYALYGVDMTNGEAA